MREIPVAMTTALALISLPSSIVNRNEPLSVAEDTTFWCMNSAPKDLACAIPSDSSASPSLTTPK